MVTLIWLITKTHSRKAIARLSRTFNYNISARYEVSINVICLASGSNTMSIFGINETSQTIWYAKPDHSNNYSSIMRS